MGNVLLFCVFLFLVTPVFCQKDSTAKDSTRTGILNNKFTKGLLKTVTRNKGELTEKNVKSEDVFKIHQGKIIRNIVVNHINFERSIYDTTRKVTDTFTRIAEKLHSDTRPNVIFNHLFFYPNKPLDPYRLADNERYLRDLDFILDSKIAVYPVEGTDSVDVEVTTRDVFSLGIRPRVSSVDKFYLSLFDANLMGRGQRIQTDFLYEGGRTPPVGKGFGYTKSSISGSLINLALAYTEMNNGPSLGEENEYSYYIRLDRPLVSPYTRMAGGVEVSRNWSSNIDNDADTVFRNYKYHVQDGWIGYNIGIHKAVENRNRTLVAIRYARQTFERQPIQSEELIRRMYNNSQYFLGGFTFYNQNFFKTNYVFGFGRTEDVPYGTTINVNAGWAEELGLRRPYLGGTATKSLVRPSGNFYSIEIGAGSFFNNKQSEDAVVYATTRYYSKLIEARRLKLRQQVSFAYGRAFNNRILDLLTLDRQLPKFSPDSLYGHERFVLNAETTVFLPGQILGFRFAPFLSLLGANLNQTKDQKLLRDFFWGITGGIRTRNENLVFGTVELRIIYYPNTPLGVDKFAINITSNLRLKYSGTFVRRPSFIAYN